MIQQDLYKKNQHLPYEEKPFIVQKENVTCHAIAINSDNNLLIVGTGYYIKVFEIKENSTLKELQLIEEHKELVLCLNFFTKNSQSRSFISAADTIIIWYESNLQWCIQTRLEIKEDNTQVKSLVIHPQEDLIISGSLINIQFWFQNLNAQSDQIQQQLQESEWICKPFEYTNTFGLSINKKGDRLVSCNTDLEILVMEGSNTTEWTVLEKIPTNAYGLRLCFITNDVIAFKNEDQDLTIPYNFTHQILKKNQFKLRLKEVNKLVIVYFLQVIYNLNNQLLIEMVIAQMLLVSNKKIHKNLNQIQNNIFNIKPNIFMVQLVMMEIFQLFGMITKKKLNLEDLMIINEYLSQNINIIFYQYQFLQ